MSDADKPQDNGGPADESMGYWERKAYEEEQARAAQGPTFNPTNAQASEPPPDHNPYAPPGTGYATPQASPYAGAPGGGVPPWLPDQAAGYPPVAHPGTGGWAGHYQPPLPKHDQANLSMILGIVGLAGGAALCGLPLFASPFAWYFGSRSIREIDESMGRLGGRSEAMAGKVLGIIGTILGILALLVIIAYVVFVVLLVSNAGTSSGESV